MRIYCSCDYCGHSFTTFVYDYESDIRCVLCADKNVKVKREPDKKDVFGYDSQAPKPDAYIRKKS